jgi:hypothetical protein
MWFTRWLYDNTTGVQYAVNATQITGPVFYHETINSDQYVRNILGPTFNPSEWWHLKP